MKTYIVGVNRAAGEVLLRAFESKDIWNLSLIHISEPTRPY